MRGAGRAAKYLVWGRVVHGSATHRPARPRVRSASAALVATLAILAAVGCGGQRSTRRCNASAGTTTHNAMALSKTPHTHTHNHRITIKHITNLHGFHHKSDRASHISRMHASYTIRQHHYHTTSEHATSYDTSTYTTSQHNATRGIESSSTAHKRS